MLGVTVTDGLVIGTRVIPRNCAFPPTVTDIPAKASLVEAMKVVHVGDAMSIAVNVPPPVVVDGS